MKENNLLNTYGRFSKKVIKGSGNYLVLEDNSEILDFLSGIAVNALGYSNEELEKELIKSSMNVIHTSNLFYTDPILDYSQKLCKISAFTKVFFSNSGTEANEGALKMVRKYGVHKKNTAGIGVITFNKAFHGRTYGSMALTKQEKIQKDFGPHLSGFFEAKYNDIESVKKIVAEENIGGIFIELMQGEGGLITATKEFVKELRNLCTKEDILLVVDEIQTGFYRCGTTFAYEYYDIVPDIMTLGKTLGCGLPLGAVLVGENLEDIFKPGDHGSTFGGNPVAASLGLKMVEEVEKKELDQKIRVLGAYLNTGLYALSLKYDFIEEIRGRFLMTGLKLSIKGDSFVQAMFNKGFLINVTGDNVLRFLPPFTITEDEIDELVQGLDEVFDEYQMGLKGLKV